MADFDEVKLTDVIVGGVPVGFTKSTGTLHLAGGDLKMEQWQEIERRINLFFHRAGLLDKKRNQGDSAAGSSSFLTANLKQILKRDEGLIKEPPFWLRWYCNGVINKQELRDY